MIKGKHWDTNYWRTEVIRHGKSKKLLKKKHKKFTSPITKDVTQGLERFAAALAATRTLTAATGITASPLLPPAPDSPPSPPTSPPSPRPTNRILSPSSFHPRPTIKITDWRIHAHRTLSYLVQLENTPSAPLWFPATSPVTQTAA